MRIIRCDVTFENGQEILNLSGLKSEEIMVHAVEVTANELNAFERHQECDELRESLTRKPMVNEFNNPTE